MKKFVWVVAVAVALWGAYFFVPDGDLVPEFTVARVIDGDTVEMGDGARVRYIGIDTPEAGECYGAEATARNRELVEGKVVALTVEQTDKDVYGRYLRYVYADEVFVNLELVRGGYARAIYITPDTARYPEFRAAQDSARSAGLGLWGACVD